MSFLNGLHGTVAALLICALLFVDEAGVPLPLAPNELLLIIAGLLMAGGALPVWLFLPLAYLALVGGMLTGYSWARALGAARLRAVASRVHAEATYDKARNRLRTATPLSLGVTRMLPGVRTYATLVAGAAGTELRTFCIGALPALLAWELGLCGLGALVGLPAEHFLSQFEKLVASGVVLIIAVVGAIVAIRHIPSTQDHEETAVLSSAPAWERTVLALSLDIGIVATLAAGVDRIVRGLLASQRLNGPVDLVVLGAAVIIGYVAVTRLGPGQTAGEGLFAVSYRAPARRPARPKTPPALEAPGSPGTPPHGTPPPPPGAPPSPPGAPPRAAATATPPPRGADPGGE